MRKPVLAYKVVDPLRLAGKVGRRLAHPDPGLFGWRRHGLQPLLNTLYDTLGDRVDEVGGNVIAARVPSPSIMIDASGKRDFLSRVIAAACPP